MKTKYFTLSLSILALATTAKAQTSTDDLLKVLTKKGVIKQVEADSLRTDNVIQQQDGTTKPKLFPLRANRAFRLSGYTQVRYQDPQQRGISSGIPASPIYGGFDVRRTRLDVKGDVASDWEYDLQTDFAQAPKIIDAQLTYKPYEFLKLTIGQQKTPLSAENNKWSDSELELIDRAQVIEALTGRTKDVLGNQNGRDIGALLWGGLLKQGNRYLVNYQIAVFNGAGINVAGDNNKAKDITGRLVLKPLAGLEFGGSFYDGYDMFTTNAIPAFNQKRTRVAAEAEYSNQDITVRVEYIHGEDGGLQREGWYALAAYSIVPKKLQVVARYDWYDPNIYNNTLVAASDRTINILPGVNYWFNNFSKLQVNYSFRQEQSPTPQVNNNLLSAQLQMAF